MGHRAMLHTQTVLAVRVHCTAGRIWTQTWGGDSCSLDTPSTMLQANVCLIASSVHYTAELLSTKGDYSNTAAAGRPGCMLQFSIHVYMLLPLCTCCSPCRLALCSSGMQSTLPSLLLQLQQ